MFLAISLSGDAPRKTALIQLCFQTHLTRRSAGVPPTVDGGAENSMGRANGRVAQDQPACAGPRHTCLLLHVAHTGITPTLAELLASPQVLSALQRHRNNAHAVTKRA